MASQSPLLHCRLFLFFFLFALICSYSLTTSAYDLSIGAHPTRLRVGAWQIAKSSPNFETSGMVCERIHIEDNSKYANLKDYWRVLKVKVVVEPTPNVLSRYVTICLHKNPSLDLGLCSQDKWEEVLTDSWFHSMLPSDDKYLDICFSGTTVGIFEVSTEEGLSIYKLALLSLSFLLIPFASATSNSGFGFYYGGAIGVGFLWLLMVLFQGSALLGLGWILVGPCLGRFVVGKFVPCEDSSVDDSSSACFKKYLIFVCCGIVAIKGTNHIWLALPPLFSSILFAPIVRRMLKLRFVLILYRICCKRNSRMGKCLINDSFSFTPGYDRMNENQSKRISTSSQCGSNRLSSYEWMNENQSTRSTPSQCESKHRWNTAVTGNCRRFERDRFYSTFHNIPGRRKYSYEDWKGLTKNSTKTALEQLMASSAFVEWAVSNRDKITLS